MEHPRPVYPMPSLEDCRRGQAEVCQRFKDGLLETVAKLPTGYGKTKTAAISFAILLAADVADVMVLVVPSAGQADQAAEDVPYELQAHGIATEACVVGHNKYLAVRLARSGKAKVFIVTVQSLLTGATLSALNEILGGERVFLVVDEHHHYGLAAAWAHAVAAIRHRAFLAMSATPDRKGEVPIYGPPHVSVAYVDAVKDGHVKQLNLNAYDYRIDFVSKGEISSFSISELIAEAGEGPDNIERWAAAREARWTPKYVSPLISHPVERLIALYADQGFRSQMIVYALCCSHAKAVCEQIAALVPETMRVDWVGTGPNGRNDDENREILRRFCPPKNADGKRPWTLDVLVCVGMAGEGLDICDATEAVFLTSPAIHNTSKQNIGRLSRVVKDQPLTGNVNVDAASEWARHTGRKVMLALDATNGEVVSDDDEEVDAGSQEHEYTPIPPGPLIDLKNVELIGIRSDPEFIAVKRAVKEEAMARGLDEAEADRIADAAGLRYKQRSDQRFNATYQQAAARQRLDARVRKVAGLALRVGSQRGHVMTREMIGDYMKRINGAKRRNFGAVEASTAAEIERQNEWVRDLEATLLRGELPSWL